MEKARAIEEVRVQSDLRLIDALNVEIKEASKTIREKSADDPDANLLMTIPGAPRKRSVATQSLTREQVYLNTC